MSRNGRFGRVAGVVGEQFMDLGEEFAGVYGFRALHLTGVVLVMASPGAGSAGAVDAGRVPGRSGRPWRRLAWLVSFDQLLVADRVVTDGELEYSQEDQAAAA